MALLGSVFFTIMLATSLFAVFAAIMHVKVPGRQYLHWALQAVYLHFFVTLITVLILLVLLAIPDLSVLYVTSNANLQLPLFYRLTSLWAGQAGSMLWWNFLLVMFSTIAILQMRRKEPQLIPHMVIILYSISFFFTALGNFSESSDPFQVITADGRPFIQPDGRGLNPLLQHWAMIIHPPILYFGYVSFAVPYAIAMAALIKGQDTIHWTKLIRRWTIFSWFFLGTGILLGGKWAYEELGWGGYWAWDPVENASLMPWLTGTAFLHSIIVQEKRGMFKVWNMVLVSISFLMTIFGTFLTRSGVVSSVHAFASSNLGPFFVFFLSVTVIFSAYWIIKRLPTLKSDRPFNSFLSREAGFLFNNVFLILSLIIVILGTMLPSITEFFVNKRISVTAEWFNTSMVPMGLFMLFLTGAGPLLAWRVTSKESLIRNFRLPVTVMVLTFAAYLIARWQYIGSFNFEKMHLGAGLTFALAAFVISGVLEEYYKSASVRSGYTKEPFFVALMLIMFQNKRRYVGYLVHIGLALLFIGFAGKSFSTETKMSLRKGEAEMFNGYLFSISDAVNTQVPEMVALPLYFTQKVTIAAYKDNKLLGQDTTEIRTYPMYSMNTGSYSDTQNTSEPAIISRIGEDLYVQLGGVDKDTGKLILQVWVNPLVFWVWFGFAFFTGASLLLLIPIGEGKTFRIFNKIYSVQPKQAEAA
jgi:cytochrome c-type biogenesis protein CcmF